MAPEQVASATAADRASDQFALAVMTGRLPALGFALVLSGVACREPPSARVGHERTEAPAHPAPLSTSQDGARSCQARIDRALASPSLPGTPVLDARRARVWMSTKGEPLLFIRPPALDSEASSTARRFAAHLAASRYPWDVLGRWLPLFAHDPRLGRETLLRDGYLYAETPELAFALLDRIQPLHLFSEPRIWLQRGDRTNEATRRGGRYVWTTGPDAGKPVRLLFLDRVGAGTPPPALHRDVRALRYRADFERARVRHLAADRIVADLRYGELWVPTLLRSRDAELEVECEVVPRDRRRAVALARDENRRRTRAVQALRRAMLAQIDEALPFDEPLTEMGPQDGRLRPAWEWAYLEGKQSFRFFDDRYPVFDTLGRPRPFQVCTDFLLDTLARASGSWFRPRGELPGRTSGGLDWNGFGGQLVLRGANRFVAMTLDHPELFEARTLPEAERIPMGELERLTAYLLVHVDEFAAGDMVLIHGFTPWDPHDPHYHSFFVYESDPLTGMPLAIAGNAGRPTIRHWRVEAQRTPKRTIMHRARPRLEWLETILGARAEIAPVPPPLTAGPFPG